MPAAGAQEPRDDHFAEVLARECTALAAVADAEGLDAWRRRVVAEIMTAHSPYARSLRGDADSMLRRDFIDHWRDLIAAAIARVDPRPRDERGDPDEVAVLVLAALLGGSVLSRVSPDQDPLNAALDLALAPVLDGVYRARGRDRTP